MTWDLSILRHVLTVLEATLGRHQAPLRLLLAQLVH